MISRDGVMTSTSIIAMASLGFHIGQSVGAISVGFPGGAPWPVAWGGLAVFVLANVARLVGLWLIGKRERRQIVAYKPREMFVTESKVGIQRCPCGEHLRIVLRHDEPVISREELSHGVIVELNEYGEKIAVMMDGVHQVPVGMGDPDAKA